jgi:hypothetical protein
MPPRSPSLGRGSVKKFKIAHLRRKRAQERPFHPGGTGAPRTFSRCGSELWCQHVPIPSFTGPGMKKSDREVPSRAYNPPQGPTVPPEGVDKSGARGRAGVASATANLRGTRSTASIPDQVLTSVRILSQLPWACEGIEPCLRVRALPAYQRERQRQRPGGCPTGAEARVKIRPPSEIRSR